MSEPEQYLPHLNILLNAPSKSIVESCLVECFNVRTASYYLCKECDQKLLDTLNVTVTEAGHLRQAVVYCIRLSIKSKSIEPVVQLFQDDTEVNPKLKQLLLSIIQTHLNEWLTIAQNEILSSYKLLDFEWHLGPLVETSEVLNDEVISTNSLLKNESTTSKSADQNVHLKFQLSGSDEGLSFTLDKASLGTILNRLRSLDAQIRLSQSQRNF